MPRRTRMPLRNGFSKVTRGRLQAAQALDRLGRTEDLMQRAMSVRLGDRARQCESRVAPFAVRTALTSGFWQGRPWQHERKVADHRRTAVPIEGGAHGNGRVGQGIGRDDDIYL